MINTGAQRADASIANYGWNRRVGCKEQHGWWIWSKKAGCRDSMGGGYGQKGDFNDNVLEENTRPFNTQALDLKVVLLHSPRNHAKSLGYA